MTIRHHPSDELLTAFAAGTLDPGAHVAVATHLVACPRCSAWRRSMEQIGGALLEKLPPAPMSAGAFAGIEARLNESPRDAKMAATTAAPSAIDDVVGLPKFMRRYPAGCWTWIAPAVRLRSIGLPDASDTRVFLLKAGPGTKLLQHSHTGLEMTCVLTGAFTHEGGRFGPGDFDLGDETVDHQPIVDAGEACICLIAMQGGLRLNGIIGRIMQPFIRL